MWGRVVEIMTAVWLGFSPFIFRTEPPTSLIWLDFCLALAITVLAALSYWRPTRHAHLVTLGVAGAMVIYGRFAELPPPPAQQNHIVVGLFLLMIAVVPNQASQPAKQWMKPVDHP